MPGPVPGIHVLKAVPPEKTRVAEIPGHDGGQPQEKRE